MFKKNSNSFSNLPLFSAKLTLIFLFFTFINPSRAIPFPFSSLDIIPLQQKEQFIKGRIFSNATNLSNAQIKVYIGKNLIAEGLSDEKGEFTIKINNRHNTSELRLVIVHNRRKAQTYVYNATKADKFLDIDFEQIYYKHNFSRPQPR